MCFEGSGSAEDNEFDAVVGALEEILLGDVFQSVQKGFCDEHCGTVSKLQEFWIEFWLQFNRSLTITYCNDFNLDKFTDSEENKIEYTELFQTYTVIIEKSLDDELTAKIPVRFIISINWKIIFYVTLYLTHFQILSHR